MAVSVPLIDGVLAVRLSGLVDHNDLDGIRSVNNRAAPYSRTESGRISVFFAPNDSIRASVMYQYLNARNRSFSQVIGSSIGGFPAFGYPSGGDPVLTAGQRLGVSDGPRTGAQEFHLVTGTLEWRFSGQKLTYVGSYSNQVASTQTPQDPYNVYRGFESYQDIGPAGSVGHRHELRLSSEERIAGMFDYTVGGYIARAHGTAKGLVAGSNPFDPSLTYISNDAYVGENAVFGSATAHFGERTEFTGGVRYINSTNCQPGPYNVVGQGNSICIPIAGFCLPGVGLRVPTSENAVVWNASLSHRFSDDFLV